jgi:Tfp pilus assembly protein PilF
MTASATQEYLRAVQAAMRADDMSGAAATAERAIAEGHEHPQLFMVAAYDRLTAGDYERALIFATRACELAPSNVDALNVKAESLMKIGRGSEAIPVFDRALLLAPDDAVLHFNIGQALYEDRKYSRARDHFERAFQLDPSRAEVAAQVAFLSAQNGDMARARTFGLRALEIDHMQAFASYAVALADIDDRNYAEAQARMTELIGIPNIGRIARALAYSILGDALDGMKRADEAFAAYSRAGEAMHELYGPGPDVDAEMAIARSKRLLAYVEKAPADSWRAAPGPSPVRNHVFLVGFPRSGTTLLAHVLASHPRVELLDERRVFVDVAELLKSEAGLDRLAAMDESGLAFYRDAYWKRVAEFGAAGSKDVFVDKMPLNCEILFLIAKLFPEAKIVFALRDPRDVVFSCFRRRFKITRQMYELLTLEGAASFYDVVMKLREVYRGKLSLPTIDIHNEDLIGDFEGETKKLCAFLGIEHDAAMSQFAQLARERAISTPSANQVVRGLYRQGMGQWRPYRDHLASVLPALAPWAARFGYPKE